MRTNYFYLNDKLADIKLGDVHTHRVQNVNIFKLRAPSKEQVTKYARALKGVKDYEYITRKAYKSDQLYPGVVVSKHKASGKDDHDTITVMFKTERGYKTAKCEVGVMNNRYVYPSFIESLDEPKKLLLKALDKLKHEQLIELFKMVYKPLSAGGLYMSDSAYTNMKCEIRELIRIDPNTDPLTFRETGPLYFFKYMSGYILTRILCNYIDITQVGTAIQVVQELRKKGVEAAYSVPVKFPIFIGM